MINASLDQAIEVLNRALNADRDGFTDLFKHRVECNRAIVDDPTIQVLPEPTGIHTLGMMGLINGIFGVDAEGFGHIAAVLSADNTKLIRFERRCDPSYVGARCEFCGCKVVVAASCYHPGCDLQRRWKKRGK